MYSSTSGRFAIIALALATAGSLNEAAANLPADFDERFAKICSSRGIVGPRCQCMINVVKEQIDDQHLVWMLEYFESGGGEDLDRRMAEYETDENKLNVLREEIEQAAEQTKKRCLSR